MRKIKLTNFQVVTREIVRDINRRTAHNRIEIKARTFTIALTRIILTDPAVDPRLRGAIALVLQKQFDAPRSHKFKNSFFTLFVAVSNKWLGLMNTSFR